jgi:hypothetical protein
MPRSQLPEAAVADQEPATRWIAFAAGRRLAEGPPHIVAPAVKAHADAHADVPVMVFDASSSVPVELDLRGSMDTVRARYADAGPHATPANEREMPRAPGRPRLGVVAREVTLLPRHWDWLATQPGGASVALRKLVEAALRDNRDADRARAAREATLRFMTAMAGNEPGFEEAARALFADDRPGFEKIIRRWPPDVARHVAVLAAAHQRPQAAAGARELRPAGGL